MLLGVDQWMEQAAAPGAVGSLAPLLRGEGWGEGLLRSASAVRAMSAVPCPSPAAKTRRPLPAQCGERLRKRGVLVFTR
ncbi:hypothetical protein SAMN05216367_4291 [Tardiphaga sp. OK245]|nr:hypothetical protein SAMN05216367_4291 [Tardiphaga sp. OK245]